MVVDVLGGSTSMRNHSPPNTMARHRTLRRAMASTAAKTPRRLCLVPGGFLTEEVQSRRHTLPPGGLARRFWGNASAHYMPATSLRNHSPPRHRTLRRAMASASQRCREDGCGCSRVSSVCLWGPACPDLLTSNAHTSERNWFGQVRFSELEWGHLGAAP